MKLRVSLSGAYQPLIDELMSRDSGHRGARMQQLAYQGLLLEQALTNGHASFSFGTASEQHAGPSAQMEKDSDGDSMIGGEPVTAPKKAGEVGGNRRPAAINIMDRQED